MDGIVINWGALAGQFWPGVATFFAMTALGTVFIANRRARRLADDHRNLVLLMDNLSEGIYRSSLDGKLLTVNQALVRMNGYRSKEEMLNAPTDIASECYVQPERCRQFRDILLRDGVVRDFVSEIYRHRTRERIWIIESARIVRDPNSGRALYYEGSVREYSDTMKRLQIEEQFQKLTRNLPGGLFQITVRSRNDTKVVYLSEGFFETLGMPTQEITESADRFLRRIHPDDRKHFGSAVRESENSLLPLDHEFRIQDMRQRERWLRMIARPERSGDAIAWHGYVFDISTRKIQALEIEKLAYYDPLTRLPNRRLMGERIAAALASCAETGRHGALFFIDLDNFKSLNDTKGHDVGDRYLVEVAERLCRCLGPKDTVARMGGDEFVVIMEDLGADEASAASRAIITANQVLSALRIPFQFGDVQYASAASLGVVLFDKTETRPDELLKRADIAMYRAKASGRDSMALFEPHWMTGEHEQFTMLGELRKAIAENKLELHFQPQVDRAGQIIGAEALLRWHHPVLGDIPPERFIAVAEQNGLITSVCKQVLRNGARTLAEWQSSPATAKLRLAVNVSVHTFATTDYVGHLKSIIDEFAIEPSRLTLELTEHVMAKDPDLIAGRMRQLKALGVRFALDDFGTGYSSLSRLKSLPFDEIKIDGNFVSDIERSESDRSLVKTILAMASTLGLETVAEHVRSAEQEAFLHAFGCDYFQGYRYGRAVSAKTFANMVGTQSAERGDDSGTRVRLRA